MTHSHPGHPPHSPAPGFGPERAAHYDAQAAIALAGAPAMYELGVSALTSQLEGHDTASLLMVGLGTGAELLPYKKFDVPGWHFTGVDPSEAMLTVARERLETEGLLARTHLHLGELHTLPTGPAFDGAQMLGVLHHLATPEDRLALLHELGRRLKPGAPLVVGCRVGAQLEKIELRRYRALGISPEMIERGRQARATMLPIGSETDLLAMLAQAGFVDPQQIFASLQFKVFLVRNEPGAAG